MDMQGEAALATPEQEEAARMAQAKLVGDWITKIEASRKEEKKWRKDVKEIYRVYAPTEKDKAPAYNVLYSNIEILLPTVYSNTPKPDARRRFGDDDPAAKLVAKAIERVLQYQVDEYDFDHNAELSVLDGLIAGRGVARVRYLADTVEVDGAEKIADETAQFEYVKYDDFVRSAGKIWADITFVGFRHRLKKAAVKKWFPDLPDNIEFDYVANEEDDGKAYADGSEADKLDKRLTVWEIWDKETKSVMFIAPCYKDDFCRVDDDPLQLKDFFPCPRPLQFILNPTTMVPTPDYNQYKKQAMELSEISRRIIAITKVLKIRGIYDGTMKELSRLLDAGDNEMISAENVAGFYEKGGIEKMIWMMPIQEAANVLQYLYTQRENTKQIIYEISGISDIMRGASRASETLGAQQIKAQYADTRLKRRQKEVQRFLRDIMRMKAEIVAEHFDPAHILQMANISEAEVQAAGVDPKMAIELLRNESVRNYRIGIETDSTIAFADKDSQEQTSAFLQAINQFFAMIGPLIIQGALPMDAAKALLMTVSRKFKMGEEFEAALDMMHEPQPKPDPAAEIDKARLALDNKKADADIANKKEQTDIKQVETMHAIVKDGHDAGKPEPAPKKGIAA